MCVCIYIYTHTHTHIGVIYICINMLYKYIPKGFPERLYHFAFLLAINESFSHLASFPAHCIHSVYYSFLNNFIYLFLVVLDLHCCLGLLLLWRAGVPLSLWCMGCSPWWLLLLQSTGCRAHGLQQLWCVGSVIAATGF